MRKVDDALFHLAENMRVQRRKKGNSKGKAFKTKKNEKGKMSLYSIGCYICGGGIAWNYLGYFEKLV